MKLYPGVRAVDDIGFEVTRGSEEVATVLERLGTAGADLSELRIETPDLEDPFLKLTGSRHLAPFHSVRLDRIGPRDSHGA